MQRLLTLSAIAVLLLASVAAPVAGVVNPNAPECNISSPDTSPRFTDNCYHQSVWFSPDTPEWDVVILPAASPYELRDLQLVSESVDMWEQGLKAMGAPWLAEGLHINDYTVGFENVPAAALADAEVVVVLTTEFNPAVLFGVAVHPFAFPCFSAPLPATWAEVPGFHQHPGSSFASLRAECGFGGERCFVFNTNNLGFGGPNPDDRRRMFDLVSHEVGHCLTLGHVGDATTESADDSDAYPEHDIMSYESDGLVADTMHCVSSLNARTIEIAFAGLLGQPGADDTPAGSYAHMDPDDWTAHACTQSDAAITDADYLLTANPLADDVDEDGPSGGVPELSITSPADGAEVDSSQLLDVEGIARFVGGTVGGSLPAVNPQLTGSVYAYNNPGIGLSNIASTGTGGPPPYPAGSDVLLSGRNVADAASRIGTDTAGFLSIVREDGTVARGPYAISGYVDEDPVTGEPSGFGYDHGTAIPMPNEPGMYFITLSLTIGGATHYVKDTTYGHPSGHKPIEVVGAAVPSTPTPPAPSMAVPLRAPSAANGAVSLRVGPAAGSLVDSLVQSLPVRMATDPSGDSLAPFMDIVEISIANEDADSFQVVMRMADMSTQVPSTPASGISYGAEFCTDNNADDDRAGKLICYRVTAINDVLGATFEGGVIQDDDSSSCGLDGIVDATASSFDTANSRVVWTVLKEGLDVTKNGEGLQDCGVGVGGAILRDGPTPVAGDKLSALVGSTGLQVGAVLTVTVNALVNDATTAAPDYTFTGGGAQPLEANAGGPYSGTVGSAIAVSGVASGGVAPYACAWSGTGATFGNAASCATTVSFAAEGTHSITLTVTDGASTVDADSASVNVGSTPPAGERIALFVDGTEVGSTPFDSEAGDEWTVPDVDLSAFADTITLEAVWFDEAGDELDSASIVLDLLSTCTAEGTSEAHGGSGGLCSSPLAPRVVSSSFALTGGAILEKDGTAHARSFQVLVEDRNGWDEIALAATAVSFNPAAGVALRATDPIVPAAVADDAGTTEVDESLVRLLLTVHFTVADSAALGLYDIGLTVEDADGDEGSAAFDDVFRIIPAGEYYVDVVGADALQFGSVESGASDVESLNYFTITNLLHEDNVFAFVMEDFQNRAEGAADCTQDGLTPVQSLDCIELAGNLKILVDPSPASNGDFTFSGDDVDEYTYDGSVFDIGTIGDGDSVGVMLVILQVGTLHEGVFGTSFSIPAPVPAAP